MPKEYSIDPAAEVHPTAIIGAKPRKLLEGEWRLSGNPTRIGAGVTIGARSLIEIGVLLEENVKVGTEAFVALDTLIGAKTVLADRAWVGPRVRIGHEGLIGEITVIGDHVEIGNNFVMESGAAIIHGQRDPSTGWDADTSTEGAACIGDNVHMFPNALVIGEVTIGNNVVIYRKAIVTRSNVPDGSIVFPGVNIIIPAKRVK